MLNISIKKEKEDICPATNKIKSSTADAPSRIIVKTLSKSTGIKGKSNKNMKNVKVKTLEEIRQEKKKKKKNATADHGGGIKSTSDVKPKTALSYPNIQLKPLSIRLMALPNGQHTGIRTFRVNPSGNNSINIKKEPDNDQDNQSNIPTATTVNTFQTVTVKQEREDIELKDDERHTSLIDGLDEISDEISDNSSFDLLGSSVDLSDIPRMSTQDDDTMSLFAFDDIFEEESPSQPDARQSIKATRKTSQGDLRDLIKNHSSHTKNHEDNTDRHSSKQENPSLHDRHKKKKREKHNKNQQRPIGDAADKQSIGFDKQNIGFDKQNIGFDKLNVGFDKQNIGFDKLNVGFDKQNVGFDKLNVGFDKQNVGFDKQDQYLEEIKRLNFLHEMVKGNSETSTIKRGVIPSLMPPDNIKVQSNKDHRRRSPEHLSQKVPPRDHEILKIRPIVAGGRGFFEDTPSLADNTTLNGIEDDYYTGKNHPSDKRHAKRHDKNNKPFKRKSTEDITSNTDQHATKRPKQVYCTTQIHLGKCHHAFCKLKHMSERELAEYKQSNQVKDHVHYEYDEAEVLHFAADVNQDLQPHLGRAHLEGPHLGGPQLGGPRLEGPQPGGPYRGGPHLGGPHLGGPHLGGPHLGGPHRGGPRLGGPQLECPRLEGPQLGGPHLGGPQLGGPQLGGPHLGGPHRGGPRLGGPQLECPRLEGPQLGGPHLGRPHRGGPRLGGPHLEGPQLGPHLGGPHPGGPHLEGPHLEGPHLGGPHLGGPQQGGLHLDGPHQGGPYLGGPQLGGGIMLEPVANEEDDTEQMCKGLAGAATQAMDRMKLGDAWQLIQHLYEIGSTDIPTLITLVERIFVLCGEGNVDADVAAQISSKAFDLIPKVRGDHNRHDFTHLIHCLCLTGQYIRAYEAYGEMKAADLKPTHEVFLDLINCSHASPDRAFDLLDEIKSMGLFKSSICNALILLSCQAKKPLLERTWLLFKDMMNSSIKPSEEAFSSLLDVLADYNEGKKILKALTLCDDPSVEPSPKCNKVVIHYSKDNADMVSASVATVCTNAEINEPQLDVETWNILLSNCYSESFNLSTKAQQIGKLMKKFKVPFLPQGYNGLLCSLSKANLTMSILEIFREMVQDHTDLTECKQGLMAAVDALTRAKQAEDLTDVVCALLNHGIMAEAKAIQMVLQDLDTKKAYEQMHDIFIKCEQSNNTLPLTCFRKLVSSLEKWSSNPAASLEVYTGMKLAYPIIPDSSADDENGSDNQTKSVFKAICKYYRINKCVFGENCRFTHADPPDGTNSGDSHLPGQSNPFVLRSSTDQTFLRFPLPPPPPPPFTMNPMMAVSAPFAYAYQQQTAGPSLSIPNYYGMPVNQVTPSMTPTTSEIPEQKPVNLKTELYAYKEKIQKATEEESFEELARIYVTMKNDQVPVCNEMLLLFYSSFSTFSNIGESLSSFVAIIDIQLDNPDSSESEAKESLDGQDHKFIGELGVALMQLCRTSHRLDEGYLVLHVLHQYNINYFQYPASFIPQANVLNSSGIALLAADMCLCLNQDPQYDGAVEVLRGCNYALPQEGYILSAEDADKRCETIRKIATHYISIRNYEVVKEFLENIGDYDNFGMTDLKTIYNELLKGYIEDKNVEEAVKIISEMESRLISRDTNVLRSFVTCLCSIGHFLQARDIFKSSCLQGAYPIFPQGEGLWHTTLWASFTTFEIQFYMDHHLHLLNKHVEQCRAASQMPYDENQLKPLRISIVEEEPDRMANVLNLQSVKDLQERIIETLGSEFNPPLSCGVSDLIGEVLVNPRSLRRWFLANPCYEYQRSPSDSDDSYTQRNVSTSEGKISVRLDVARQSGANLNQHNGSPPSDKTVVDKIKHTICGHLTRYFRSGVISSKEEFKRFARVIAQDYFRQHRDVPKDYNKLHRNKVINFVDRYFDHSNS